MRSLFAIATALCVLTACGATRSEHRLKDGTRVLSFSRDHLDAHLVASPGGAFFLVDSGPPEGAQSLDEELRQAGFDPAKLKGIIVTHAHWDHGGGARFFQEKYGTPVYMGKGDEALLQAGKAGSTLCPTSFLARWRVDGDSTHTMVAPAKVNWLEGKVPLDSLVGVPGQVVLNNSHTPGSLAVIVGEAAFVGDFFRGSLVGGGAEVHLYICDTKANRERIQQALKDEAAGATIFFTGHFGPVSRDAVVSEFAK
jgi:glyoxylase-like metal-dependent hydrolase (beta-lactamase superfamily II)